MRISASLSVLRDSAVNAVDLAYGFVTVIAVPVLSPSGSWLFAAWYVYELRLAPVTVKVAAVLFFETVPVVTWQTPVLPVVQEPVPKYPALQLPETVTPLSGL